LRKTLPLPPLTSVGDLPLGVHPATLQEVLERFGSVTLPRMVIARRLERIYRVARSTGQLGRFVIFGSFITSKLDPNDVDVFLLMDDAFEVSHLVGEARLLFDHPKAQVHFGASVFWIRRFAALGGEQEAMADWQIKRDGGQRGIVEIVEESQ
jgi:hypothetical protein